MLYKTTKELIKAHKRNRKLTDALEQAKQKIASLTSENQQLRDLLKKHGIDVSNES